MPVVAVVGNRGNGIPEHRWSRSGQLLARSSLAQREDGFSPVWRIRPVARRKFFREAARISVGQKRSVRQSRLALPVNAFRQAVKRAVH